MNKLFDIDWWNGTFFETLATSRHPMPLYNVFAPYFDDLALAKIMGLSSIVIELLLAILFLFKSMTQKAVIIGLIFHFSMLILTQGKLSLSFLYIMSSAYVILLNPFDKKIFGVKSVKFVYLYFAIIIGAIIIPAILNKISVYFS